MDFPLNFLQIVLQEFSNQMAQYVWPITVGSTVGSNVESTGTGKLDDVWAQIQQALNQFYNLLWPMVTVMAGVGTASMIVLEIWKTFPYAGGTRQKSHEQFFKKHIEEWVMIQIKMGQAKKFPFPDPAKNHSKEEEYFHTAVQDLIRLVAGGETRGFYSLKTKDLIEKVRGITDLIVTYSQNFTILFLCFAAPADREDAKAVLVPPSQQPQHEKNRINHFVKKSIDGLQFKLERDWEYWNKQRAFWINFGFVFLALVLNSFTNKNYLNPRTYMVYFLVAVLGGFIAPIAKDLVNKLTDLKKRPI